MQNVSAHTITYTHTSADPITKGPIRTHTICRESLCSYKERWVGVHLSSQCLTVLDLLQYGNKLGQTSLIMFGVNRISKEMWPHNSFFKALIFNQWRFCAVGFLRLSFVYVVTKIAVPNFSFWHYRTRNTVAELERQLHLPHFPRMEKDVLDLWDLLWYSLEVLLATKLPSISRSSQRFI